LAETGRFGDVKWCWVTSGNVGGFNVESSWVGCAGECIEAATEQLDGKFEVVLEKLRILCLCD